MKKKIFLSFRPEFFRLILYDIKKYEYRKRFCKEPTTAYLYLSAPVQEVIGIMELGTPIHIDEEILEYDKKSSVYARLKENLNKGELFAIPIESLELYKKPIPISKIKELEPDFSIPQCYLNIENHPKVFDYLNSQQTYDVEFYNDHKKIYENNLGMSCKEMETTVEFKEKDKIYLNDSKYDIIKCGYLNK